jgi:hypothetical protein
VRICRHPRPIGRGWRRVLVEHGRHGPIDIRVRFCKPLLGVDEAAGLGESKLFVYRSIERSDLPLSLSRIDDRLRIPRGALQPHGGTGRSPVPVPKDRRPYVQTGFAELTVIGVLLIIGISNGPQ